MARRTVVEVLDLVRKAQADVLWSKGSGEGFNSFEDYLATIPEIPEALKTRDERFPFLVLVDPRPGFHLSRVLAGVKYDDDKGFEDFDPKKARAEKVYWMRAQDGQHNRGKFVQTCRDSFAKDELGLTAMEGVALYVQNPNVIDRHYLHLVGSVSHESRGYVAVLGEWDDGPELIWNWYAERDPYYGSASRLE